MSWVRSPTSVRSLDDCFPATAPGRRPPPARSLCEDRADRRRQIRTLGFAQEDASAPIGERTTGFNRKEAWSAGRTARSPSPKRERPSPVRQVPIRAKVQHLADRALRDPASRRGSAARRSPHASRRMQHDRVAASLSAYEAGRISRPGGPAASGESHRQSCVPKLVSTMSRFKTRVSYGTRFRRWSQGWRPDVP